MKRAIFIANTVLSLGLNIVIARLGLDPRWRYLVWVLIAANEIRGAYFVYTGGTGVYHATTGWWL